MKSKLLSLFLALAASVGTLFAEIVKIGDLYYNLNATDKTAEVRGGDISVTDNSLADWEALPQEFIASATCPAGAPMTGLKSVKVFADAKYIYILVEPNMDDLPDLEWVPFHVLLDTDNSDATGGYGDEFTDANTDIMLEGSFFMEDNPYSYNPYVFKWWGEVGKSGWSWTDPSVEHSSNDCWGAIVCEGQLQGCSSQYVDGKFEIQIDRTCIPATWNTSELGIGFDIQQNWSSVGILPCAAATDENPSGKAAKMKVKIADAAATGVISGNVVIPASVSYEGTSYSVTGIADYAFCGCTGLTSVTIPNSVTSIGSSAFSGCSSLTSVTLNSNAIVSKEYGGGPNIGHIFGSQVKEYIIGESVASIGNSAFSGCSSLTSVTIPNSVTSIGEMAFKNCSGLTKVNITDIAAWCNIAFGDDTSNPLCYAKHLFVNDVEVTDLVIPNGVTSIGHYAFYGCNGLTSVTIGNSVTRIGSEAFYGCSGLTKVNITDIAAWCNIAFVSRPSNPLYHAKHLFVNNVEVTELIIPNIITSIGKYAFVNCSSLTSVTIPNSVTSIGGNAFSGCSGLTSVTLNSNAIVSQKYSKKYVSGFFIWSNIGSRFGSQVKEYIIGESVTSIGECAFGDCSSLTSVTIPNSVTSIGGDAFYGCRIASINFTGTIEEWCNKSWSPTQISSEYQLSINGEPQENVIIPNSVTNIGGNAFNGCSNLKNILLGTSVKVIEASAISNCPALEAITCYSMRPPTVNNGTFQTLPNNIIIFVPADYLNTYKMHDFWGMYDVRPIGAATTETTSVQVTPDETAATVAWPTVSGAETYEMVIKDKDGNVVCTLIFNSNGQLTEIAFNAPARNDAIEQTQATGFSFTVTGLEEGTSYNLTITAKDGNGTTLDEKTIAFTTSGETGVDALQTNELRSSKVMRNGQVLIMRDGKMYNVQGIEMK